MRNEVMKPNMRMPCKDLRIESSKMCHLLNEKYYAYYSQGYLMVAIRVAEGEKRIQ